MTAIVAVGTQYGDEGKGKVVDFLAKDADFVVRYNGGPNAGHTIEVENIKAILHQIPSGILYGKTCIIGQGTVLNLETLEEEIKSLEDQGVSVRDKLKISGNAHLILPTHVSESQTAKSESTGRGIAPTYGAKSLRLGLRAQDIINISREDLDEVELSIRPDLTKHRDFLLKFKEYSKSITNVPRVLSDALKENKNILLEGAQGTGLDIDNGQYPFTSSSNATSGGATVGTGLPPTKIKGVIGIAKAYVSRVDRDGSSPLTTQIEGDFQETLREKGGEYGATTGRPRRVGWFDAVLLRHAVLVNGLKGIALTKLDILDGFEELKICTHYELDGERIEDFPTDAIIQKRCKPVYETFTGWKGNIFKCKSYDELPEEAKKYIKRIEELIDCPAVIISTGPNREDTIVLEDVWK
jgi:adenylosuccinate synthase